MKTAQIYYVVWRERDYFVARCLNFDVDVSAIGDTKEDALSMCEADIVLFLANNGNPDLRSIGQPEIITSVMNYA